MHYLLLFSPALAAIAAFLLRSDRLRRGLLVFSAAVHSLATLGTWYQRPGPALGGWLTVDSAGQLFLTITSGLFLAAAIYAAGYLSREQRGTRPDFEEDVIFVNISEPVFTGGLLLFLATMTLVTLSHHISLLWVAVEGTTLVSAPLIHYHRHHRSLEATWKYLLICSVGLALALLGNFFLAVSAANALHPHQTMTLEVLIEVAPQLDPLWLKAAFILLFIGYGTKMGLAPLHTWLPDAHSEAPSVVSALLSGALLNCAFLAILRLNAVTVASGLQGFGSGLLILFGLVSMAFAAAFLVAQTDFKRMLAYSSVEHMGILAFGAGIGAGAGNGAFLHAVNHSVAKGMLFLLAGNILATYRTKRVAQIQGVSRVIPRTGWLWLIGFFAITGTPPFGTFVSEFQIVKGALDQGRWVMAGLFLLFALVAFIGMATVFLKMTQGRPGDDVPVPTNEPGSALIPPAVLACLALMLGLYVPPALRQVIDEAARLLGTN